MYKTAMLLLALVAAAPASAAEPVGLRLNIGVDKLTSRLPVLNNLITDRGVTVPLLGKLPGLNVGLGPRLPVLANVNASDLLNAVNVGDMGKSTVSIISNAVQNLAPRNR